MLVIMMGRAGTHRQYVLVGDKCIGTLVRTLGIASVFVGSHYFSILTNAYIGNTSLA